MKNTLFALLLPVLLCGCFTAQTPPTVSYWLLEYRGRPTLSPNGKFGATRLTRVIVDMPYGGNRLVVLRADGTVAYDHHNVFVSEPATLLRSVCYDAAKGSGLFSEFFEVSSGAVTEVNAEILVRRLALDCRQEGQRRAIAEIQVRLLENRSVAATATGAGSAEVADGNFGEAFSKAVSEALDSAFAKMR